MPLVSVVIANYNYGRYLASAVESVLAQTFDDLELIVVDDGSTDDSLAVLERFIHDPRARVIRGQRLGQPRAKNAALAEATAPLIAFLDADDIWDSRKLERQLPLFDVDSKIGVLYSRRTLIDETGRELPYRQPELFRGDVLSRMLRNNFVCFSSAVVRRIVFEHVGWFDPTVELAIDYDLWLRVASHYHFDYADQPLVQYRVGHGNLSRRVGERLKTAMLMMRRFVHERGGSERVEPNVLRQSFAETCCSMGFALRPFDTIQGIGWFLRAMRQAPAYRLAWRGLLSSCIPAAVRSFVRGGRSWDAAYRAPENDPRDV